MNESDPELNIRRILVALDASTHSLAALQAAAELAADLQAELVGLYVEDENLLSLAGLPFALELRPSTAMSRPMSSDKMERQLQLQASQARQALQEAAERVQARWSFRSVRGQVTSSILEAALQTDLLAMGRMGRRFSSRDRLGSTARAATADTTRSLLLIGADSDLSYPVLVTYDGSPAAAQAMATAVRLAHASGDDLNILLVSETSEEAAALKAEANIRLKKRGVSAKFHRLPQATVASLAEMVWAAENCILVLGGDNPLLRAEAIQELLDATDCPVMLVR